jgi:hypothetical protein
MKGERKILLRIIFLLAVICPGMNAYSNQPIQTTVVAHSFMESCCEDNGFTDNDFFDDEQVNPASNFVPLSVYLYQISIPQTCRLILRYPTSIWQPPKSK